MKCKQLVVLATNRLFSFISTVSGENITVGDRNEHNEQISCVLKVLTLIPDEHTVMNLINKELPLSKECEETTVCSLYCSDIY